jgi:hypothetical protein
VNLNLAEMTVIALCYFLFHPFEERTPEDFITLGEGFYQALPGLSPEMKEKVVAMARERLEYLRSLPPLPAQSKSLKYREEQMAFLDSLANDPDFFDKIAG